MSVNRLRILPRSLAGWSLLILINVLLFMCFAQLVSLYLISQKASNFVERDTIADRVYVLDRTFRATPQSEWLNMVRALDTTGFRVALTEPSSDLLAMRARERPLVETADIAWAAWQKTKPDHDAFVREIRANSVLIEALLGPSRLSDDKVVADSAKQMTRALDELRTQSCCSWAGVLDWMTSAWNPNTAALIPAASAETPSPVWTVMRLDIARLNPEGTEPVAQNRTQRVSPFVRAWYGERFDERPYLMRSPIDQHTLRVVLPVSTNQWITIDAGTAEGFSVDLLPMLLGFLAVGVIVTFLAGFVIVRLTAPLGRFAEATERLGNDVNAPPLPVRGAAEVRRAAEAFNEMQARIQAYVRDRTTMLAAISHDLRTPLTRLRLRGEFMAEEQQARYYRDLDEMEAMIASSLDFAGGEAKSETATQIDLAGYAREIAGEMAESGKSVTCQIGPEPLVTKLRPLAFKRALTNLIENALIYGHSAKLNLVPSRQAITLTVDDEGPGIPDDQLERVFAPFYRLESSRNRATGGVGLGLASARSILRSLGGEVTLVNRNGGGLRAIIALPR